MEFVYEKIFVPNKHSFITRKLEMDPHSQKIHSHNNFELNLITSGSGRRIVGNNISSYVPGDLVLLGPNIPHCWEVLEVTKKNPPECIVTHFYENIRGSSFFNIAELSELLTLLHKAERGIHFKGTGTHEVADSLRCMVNLKGLDIYIELLKVFSKLLKINDFHYLTLPNSVLQQQNKDHAKLEKVYEYVFQNLQNGINIKDASSHVFMEPQSFCRYFKKKTNKTFMDYVKNVRIGIATKLLAETDKSITQIAFESGYNNLSNFNCYFKELIKKTPSEYRRDFQ